MGSRTSKQVAGGATTTYTYASGLLQGYSDTAGNSVGFGYDNNGNRTSRTAGSDGDVYTYDAENRLISLSQGGTQYGYLYDYRTRRLNRTEGAVSTDVIFSGGTSVEENTESGSGTSAVSSSVDFIRGSDWGGGVGGILYSVNSGGGTKFDHYDGRGDVATQTNNAGTVTYQANYEAWGTHTTEFGSDADRQRANTKEEDPTGLLNEGMRYRDLEAAVFLTPDPAGFVDGPNRYAYVRQNPWTKFDPEGLSESWNWHWNDTGILGKAWTIASSPFHAGFDFGLGIDAAAVGVGNIVSAYNRGVDAHTQLEHSEGTPEQFQAFREQQHENIDEVGHDLAAVLPLIPGTSMTGPAALPETAGTGTLESGMVRDSTGSIENSASKTNLIRDNRLYRM